MHSKFYIWLNYIKPKISTREQCKTEIWLKKKVCEKKVFFKLINITSYNIIIL